jgi:predicted amidophosphoribosyltransferase
MRGWWRDFTDLVLPVDCEGCGRPRTSLCAGCRALLCDRVPVRVRPDPAPPGLPVVHAMVPYEGQARSVLLAHKERGALGLAGALGCALAAAVCASAAVRGDGGRTTGVPPGGAGSALLLVPMPSARRAVRARGHDPARRIALAASVQMRRGGVPARVLAVLRQRRPVADQSGLSARERLENLSGALELAAGGERLLAGARVVLVDDLMTTGASLAEAARALRAFQQSEPARSTAPVGVLSAAVVAATPKAFG